MLEFEKPIAELEEKLVDMKRLAGEMTKDPALARELTKILKNPELAGQLLEELKGREGAEPKE